MFKKVFAFLLCLFSVALSGCDASKQIDKAAIAESVAVTQQDGDIFYTFYVISQNELPKGFSVKAESFKEAYLKAKNQILPNLSLSKLEMLVINENLCKKVLKNDVDFIAKSSELSPSLYITLCDGKSLKYFSQDGDALSRFKELILHLKKNNKSVRINCLSIFNSLYKNPANEFDISYIDSNEELKANTRKIKP